MRILPTFVICLIGFTYLLLPSGCIRVKTESPAEAVPDQQPSQTQNSQSTDEDRPQMGPVDDDAPDEFTELPSGLKYRILRKSDGASPQPGDEVTFHTIGKQTTGERFEHSYLIGTPVTLRINKKNLIDGLYEGLLMCNVGGMIEFEIPSRLAYGAGGNLPKIPANADLVYIIELLSIQSEDGTDQVETGSNESTSSIPPAPALPE